MFIGRFLSSVLLSLDSALTHIFTHSRKVGVNVKLSTWDQALIHYTGD